MKPTQKQIEQAFERGIKPGAVIECASGDGERDKVTLVDQWYIGSHGIIYCTSDVCVYSNKKWATVITPAPEDQRDTLQPGDATLIESAAGRQYIKELAEAKGLWWCSSISDTNGIWVGKDDNGKLIVYGADLTGVGALPTHEFLRRLESTPPPVKERTPEEKLEEAVELINELCSSSYAFVKNENTSRKRIFDKAQAFLKKIER